MLVNWDPEDGEQPQTWRFDPNDVLRKEAQAIEQQYGEGYDQWLQALRVGQIKARTVLLWHMLRQVHSKLRFEDVPDFRVRQLTVQMDVGELRDLWTRLSRTKMSPELRAQLEAAFEVDLRDAMARDGMDGDVRLVDGQFAIEGAVEPPKGD